MKKTMLLAAVVVLAACAPLRFAKPGLDPESEQAKKDAWECRVQATQMAHQATQLYGTLGARGQTGDMIECMAARGYEQQ